MKNVSSDTMAKMIASLHLMDVHLASFFMANTQNKSD